MWTRRIWTPWDTAQTLAPLLRIGVIVRFSTPRQKLQVALCPIQAASVQTSPWIATSPGTLPKPDHLSVEADGDIDLILARLEQQRVPPRAELGAFLLLEDSVDPFLYVLLRRVEHQHFRAEVGFSSNPGSSGTSDKRHDRKYAANKYHDS